MSSALVSIIIPYYNKKDTIIRSINSVLSQTFTNWELIIIDDCGKDKIDVNMLPQDDRIRVLFNESNKGAACTRQRGLENSKGGYIAFLDADDWWAEKFLSYCLKELEKEKNSDGAYVLSSVVVSNEPIGYRRYSNLGLTQIRETIIQYARPWQTGSILWRKESTGNWGKLKTYEDSWFEISSAKFNKLVFVNHPLHFFDKTNPHTLSTFYDSCATHKNQQLLFIEIFNNHFYKLNLKYKIILINRLIRGQLKINEYCCNDDALSFSIKIKKHSVILSFLFRIEIILYFLQKTLQRTKYRINF